MDENGISRAVMGAALEVHRAMGPGLLESVYRRCLERELSMRGMAFESEVPLRATYKGLTFDAAYRLDMVVGGKVVLELKAVERLLPVHESQLLSYLRLGGLKLGMLINFHQPQLRSGVKRVVNGL